MAKSQSLPQPTLEKPVPEEPIPNPRRYPHNYQLVILAIVALAIFSFRGIWRGYSNSIDLQMLYASSATWAEGGEVYAREEVIETFCKRGGDRTFATTAGAFMSFYPPSTYAFLSPLTLFRWPAVKIIWICINVMSSAVIAYCGFELLKWEWPQGAILMLCIVALFAPVHTTLSQGQLSLVCTALLMLGLVCLKHSHELLAGLAMGLAIGVKPQVGGLLVLLLPIVKSWRGLAAAAGAALVLLIFGVARLELNGTPWFGQMLASVKHVAPGSELGAGAADPNWYVLVSLETLVSRFISNITIATILSCAVTAVFVVIIAMAYRRASNADQGEAMLLAAGALLTLSLLPVYHRFYDAVVLLLPAFLVADSLLRTRRLTVPVTAVGIGALLFYLPNSAVLGKQLGDMLGHRIQSSLWFEATVMTNQIWAILAILIGMILWLCSVPGEIDAA